MFRSLQSTLNTVCSFFFSPEGTLEPELRSALSAAPLLAEAILRTSDSPHFLHSPHPQL